jgi:hypothetical protein
MPERKEEPRHATPEELKKAFDEADECIKRWRELLGVDFYKKKKK